MMTPGAADELSWDASVDGISALPIRVVEPLDWELVAEKDAVRIHMDRSGRDSWLKPRVAHILRGLEAGDSLPGIVETLVEAEAYPSPSRAEANARSLILGLAEQGNIEIELPRVPQVFDDRYERIEELGRGTVGVVWLCRDLEAPGQDPVVVKHAWNWSGPLQARDANLREEARLMRSLDHDGIVPYLDGFEIDDRFHLVRGFVEGEDLALQVLEHGAPAPATRKAMARQVAGILDHMHDRSILCMDLKPSNLMTQPDGSLIFGDLGHCREIQGDQIPLERVPGTRGFLAPEIFAEHLATRTSDIYSLGKLYEFLTTAYPPNQGEQLEDVIDRMEKRGAGPADVAFVRACLQEHRDDRPSTAGQAVEHLA